MAGFFWIAINDFALAFMQSFTLRENNNNVPLQEIANLAPYKLFVEYGGQWRWLLTSPIAVCCVVVASTFYQNTIGVGWRLIWCNGKLTKHQWLCLYCVTESASLSSISCWVGINLTGLFKIVFVLPIIVVVRTFTYWTHTREKPWILLYV